MGMPLLNDVIVIFGLAIAVIFICHQLRVPKVVGFLLTGDVRRASRIWAVEAIHGVEFFAEIGIVLLLFTIGIEFSLERLLQMGKTEISLDKTYHGCPRNV